MNSKLYAGGNNNSASATYTLGDIHKNNQQRLKGLALIMELTELVRLVQQHRAVTIGALGGNSFFESKTHGLARNIKRQMALIATQKSEYGELLSDREWQDVQDNWLTVHHQWRQDTVIDNFELHSFFVKQLLQMIWQMGEKAEGLIQTAENQAHLSRYTLKELPEFAELVGQIRGLGTQATVEGGINDACRLRLKYLTDEMDCKKQAIQKSIIILPNEYLSKLKKLPNDGLVIQLQQMIKNDILKNTKISTSADDFFRVSTQIIDENLDVMKDGLLQLKLSMDVRIAAWVTQACL